MSAEPQPRFLTLHEIVKAAHNNLARGEWDYLIGGVETETTLKRNRRALDSWAFRPRVLRDVRNIDPSVTFLGRKVRLPVLLAPIGSIESFCEGGGATAALAAESFGVPQMLSSVCKPGLEAVAQAAPDAQRVFQLYVRGDESFVDDHVQRAIDNGYTAFCFTVDTAMYSRRERDLIKRFQKPWRRDVVGIAFQSALNWADVKRFKEKFDLPLALKGIATAEDAAIACEYGVDFVYVSNHGGRQLDHGRGALEVLPEVVKAVDAAGGETKVIFDGGVMRGSDVVKAVTLGAHMVGIGRLAVIGLAADGQAGLERALELLEDEVRITLGLLGVRSFEELTLDYLHPAEPVTAPHALSAFPFLAEAGY